jgi:hypothetical protein
MIHIATVHWHTDKWIDIQQWYFQRHIKSSYRVYAWLNNVSPDRRADFHYFCSEPVKPHAVKLNILGDIICASARADDDVVVFIDGDAFPVADIDSFIAEKLRAHALIAVRRDENNGDLQPHPSFCATTVGFWRALKGDWKAGYKWPDKDGKWVTDVGGNLLKQLIDGRIDWYSLLRSNKHNYHPLFFGIYDGVLYHHGAGFRNALSRADVAAMRSTRLNRRLSRISPSLSRALMWSLSRKVIAETNRLSEDMFKRIHERPLFYTELV